MKRVYEIYHPEGKKLPEGVKRRIHVREPAHYPTATPPPALGSPKGSRVST